MADQITTAADQRHEALRARRGGGRGHAAQRLGAIGIGPGGAAGTEAGAGAGRGGREEQTAPRSRPFDTLKAATRLREEAGFDEKQATALVQTFADRGVENLATREELAAIRGEMATRAGGRTRRRWPRVRRRGEITVLRGDLEKTELALRGDMEKNVASLRGDMHKLEQRMTMRLGTVIAAGVAIVVALDKLL